MPLQCSPRLSQQAVAGCVALSFLGGLWDCPRRQVLSQSNPDVTEVCKVACLARLVYVLSGSSGGNRHPLKLLGTFCRINSLGKLLMLTFLIKVLK